MINSIYWGHFFRMMCIFEIFRCFKIENSSCTFIIYYSEFNRSIYPMGTGILSSFGHFKDVFRTSMFVQLMSCERPMFQRPYLDKRRLKDINWIDMDVLKTYLLRPKDDHVLKLTG